MSGSGKHPHPGRRVSLGDGQPPAYVFTSPCCGKPTLVPAWMVTYAREHTDGRLLLECGRHTTDQLRAVGAVRAEGCGRRYTVQLDRPERE